MITDALMAVTKGHGATSLRNIDGTSSSPVGSGMMDGGEEFSRKEVVDIIHDVGCVWLSAVS